MSWPWAKLREQPSRSSVKGIGKAMESAEIAAHVVDKALSSDDLEDLNDYPRLIERHLRPRYRGYEVASRWLSQAWLNDLVALRVSKSDFLRNAVAGIITEEDDPREVFSLRGILRSFWK